MSVTNNGRGLESTVIASQRDLIRVSKMPQASKWVGKRIIPQKGPVDFVGVVCGTGRGIYFDAKQNDRKTRFPVGDPAFVSPHQIDFLIRYGEAGAIAGLLVEATALGRFLWLDWSCLTPGTASVTWSDPRWVDLGDNKHAIRFDRLILPAGGTGEVGR